MNAEWSIQELAKVARTTSRTLRHYGELGLLPPTRIGSNGYRYYDQESLVRLQRILLLRELGLGLPAIAEVLHGQKNTAAALRTHLELLKNEQDRIARQIASVQTTLRKTEAGEQLMADEVFDGFDHTRYKDEVIERWGQDAYEKGDRWWRSMSVAEQKAHIRTHEDIAADYARAHTAGLAADSDEVQAIVQRHYDWIGSSPSGGPVNAQYFNGLADMYVGDPRFAQNYDKYGEGNAEYVRAAIRVYSATRL
ncbi:MerR family transcriptional regulator [Nocardia sp. ET3-3]|uniref:MerR family transcriptional regulator n=1 Tax=Nocardia terrae TaxID=2675851 RepID=A0A7K1UZN9_9NOCA|nr:MerR family transcriptional regulator [Nocardia terrae]